MNATITTARYSTVFSGESKLSNGYTVISIEKDKDDTNFLMRVQARDPEGRRVRFVFDTQKNTENGGLALIPPEYVLSFFPGMTNSAKIGMELKSLLRAA